MKEVLSFAQREWISGVVGAASPRRDAGFNANGTASPSSLRDSLATTPRLVPPPEAATPRGAEALSGVAVSAAAPEELLAAARLDSQGWDQGQERFQTRAHEAKFFPPLI